MSAQGPPSTLAPAGSLGSEVVGISASWKVCPRAGATLELGERALPSELERASGKLGPRERAGALGPSLGGRKGVRGTVLCSCWMWAGARRPRVLSGRRDGPAPGRDPLPQTAWGAFVAGGKQCPRPEDAVACPEAQLRGRVGDAGSDPGLRWKPGWESGGQMWPGGIPERAGD